MTEITRKKFWAMRKKSSEEMASDPTVYEEARDIAQNRCTISTERLFRRYTI